MAEHPQVENLREQIISELDSILGCHVQIGDPEITLKRQIWVLSRILDVLEHIKVATEEIQNPMNDEIYEFLEDSD